MLDQAVRYFVEDTHIMACMTVACGTSGTAYVAQAGCTHFDGTGNVNDRTLFDLASLTKLFTGLTVMRLWEENRLSLDAPVTDYAPQLTNLTQVTVDQVLGFDVALTTPERIDTQLSREAGLRQLAAIVPKPQGTGRYYSDMHAMVLGLVIEGVCQMPLMDCIGQEILAPLHMSDTFAHVPDNRLPDCVCYDWEHRIEGGRYMVRKGITPGTPHDPKARLLGEDGRHLCGHAGLFSTRKDMIRLCQGLLNGKLLKRSTLQRMAQNRLGRQLPDGRYTQYLGSQCYVKHPMQYFSEIPVYMSDEAIGLSGFTGNHVAIDPQTGIFSLMLGNRVMNRLTTLIPESGKSLTDYGLAPDGSGKYFLPDGSWVYSSVDYVHQKDEHLHKAIAEVLGAPVWHKA